MNIGLITTFVIGGLFMISMMMFNQQFASGSQEFLLSTINQEYLDDVVTVLSNDFNRIGYNAGIADPIFITSDDRIRFRADVYDNDPFAATNITWHFDTSSPVTSSPNPSDFYLIRTGPTNNTNSSGQTKFPVSLFKVKYYTANGVELTPPITDKSAIKKIEVQIIAESGSAYTVGRNSEDFYPKSVWKRIFVPNNINLPY